MDFPTEMAVMCLQFFMCYMYATLIPLAVPIFTFYLFLAFICKRYIILNYTKRIPADQGINAKIINLLPFIILIHGVLGIWGRTADGIFDNSAFFSVISLKLDNPVVLRAITDIIMLGASAVILAWIIFDYTIVNCFGALRQACKDELELPVVFSAIENVDYASRLRKSNILGSYKLINNPIYRHPYNVYSELMKRVSLNQGHDHVRSEMEDIRNQNSQLHLMGGDTSQLQLSSNIRK